MAPCKLAHPSDVKKEGLPLGLNAVHITCCACSQMQRQRCSQAQAKEDQRGSRYDGAFDRNQWKSETLQGGLAAMDGGQS